MAVAATWGNQPVPWTGTDTPIKDYFPVVDQNAPYIVVTNAVYGFDVELTVPDGFVYVTLERRQNGMTLPVYGAQNLKPPNQLAATYNIHDTMVLQNTRTEYRGVGLWTDGSTSEIVKGPWVSAGNMYVDFGADVLFNIDHPDVRLGVHVEDIGEQSYSSKREVVFALGRPDPVVVSGRRHYPSSVVTLLTLDDKGRRDMMWALGHSSHMAFSPQHPNYGYDHVPYWSIGEITESRTSIRGYEPSRRWRLEVQEITPPRPAELIASPPIDIPEPPVDPPPHGGDWGDATILWSTYQNSYWSAVPTLWGDVAGA